MKTQTLFDNGSFQIELDIDTGVYTFGFGLEYTFSKDDLMGFIEQCESLGIDLSVGKKSTERSMGGPCKLVSPW